MAYDAQALKCQLAFKTDPRLRARPTGEMPSYSELVCMLCLRCSFVDAAVFTLGEAEQVVAGLDDRTMMRYPV